MDKKKKTKTQKRFKGNNDEEKRSLLNYEGGEEAAPEGEEKPKEEEPEKKEEEKKEEPKEEEEPVDDTHCCCKWTTALMIYGIFLWLFGILALANILVIFANIYFPWYYPFVSLLLFLVFFAGLILIAIWFCKDVAETRTSIVLAGWLIIGSTVALIIWNVFYILNHNKHKHEGVKVGNGEDPDDYDEEDRATYIEGYLIWGLVILVLAVLFLYCAISYKDTFPPEDEEEMMEETKMDEEMKKEEPKEEEPKAEAEGEGAGEAAEGGQVERRSANSKRSSRRGQ